MEIMCIFYVLDNFHQTTWIKKIFGARKGWEYFSEHFFVLFSFKTQKLDDDEDE